MNWIRVHLLTPFYNQDRKTQARLVTAIFLVAALCLAVALVNLFAYATQPTTLETPDRIYAAAQRSMVVLANLQAGLPCFILAVGLGILGYKWWVRTATGRSACAWVRMGTTTLESEAVKAAKTRNQGTLQAAWILGSLIFFGLVLR